MSKVLVVDDDQDIRDLISFNLSRAGMQPVSVGDGDEALHMVDEEDPDLVVLDIMMPGVSGIDVLKKLKYQNHTRDIPVIMLTAKSEEVDRVLGLELGADDYVTKPFSVRELTLRIQRVLDRSERTTRTESTVLRCGGISLDTERYEVRVHGSVVRLTTTEFNLLAYLLENKSRVVSRDRLLEEVWGYRYGGTTRTVDTHIQRLRDKLGGEASLIETVRGVGYKLEPTRA